MTLFSKSISRNVTPQNSEIHILIGMDIYHLVIVVINIVIIYENALFIYISGYLYEIGYYLVWIRATKIINKSEINYDSS